jgi:hypothetical protein
MIGSNASDFIIPMIYLIMPMEFNHLCGNLIIGQMIIIEFNPAKILSLWLSNMFDDYPSIIQLQWL